MTKTAVWARCVASACLVLFAVHVDAFITSGGKFGSAHAVLHGSRTASQSATLSLRAASQRTEGGKFDSRRSILQILFTSAVSVMVPSESRAQGALDVKPPASAPQQAPKPRPRTGDTKDVLSGSSPSALRKGQAAQSTNRNKILVPDALKKKAKGPTVTFPSTVADLKAWNQTESGLYFQELAVGNGSSPKKGNILEVNYIGAVCDVDKDGTYDCAEPSGDVEIYPSMPQGILKDSPSYDSSFERGRPMKVRFGGAQLCKGLEEALAGMQEGGRKLVFLVPELSFACPKGRVCVADIEVDQRLAFYIELVSVGKASNIGN